MLDIILLTIEKLDTFDTIVFGGLCCSLMALYCRLCFYYNEIMNIVMFAILLIMIAGEYYDYFDIPWWSYVEWLVFLIIWFIASELSPDKEKKCAWCNSRYKLKFIWGEETQRYWEYRNIDGSRDKRVAKNYEVAGYASGYHCEECGAVTGFKHFVSKNPGKNTKISRRVLGEKGDGERVGTDWSSDDITIVDPSEENRKGK